MPKTESPIERKQPSRFVETILGILMIPLLAIGACLVIPCIFILRWIRYLGEHSFSKRMRSRGRLIPWAEFLRTMRGAGGTCIEERFSPKGPVRFWWTPEDVYRESPHEIIDWFTMRKGGRFEPSHSFAGAASVTRARTGAARSWWRRRGWRAGTFMRCGQSASRMRRLHDGWKWRRRRLCRSEFTVSSS
jgi:hypothetical protein